MTKHTTHLYAQIIMSRRQNIKIMNYPSTSFTFYTTTKYYLLGVLVIWIVVFRESFLFFRPK